MNSSNIFFIVGRGRSGTSLLQTMLNQNEHIAIAPEAQFIMMLKNKYQHKGIFSDKDKEGFYNDLWLEKRLLNWKLDKELLFSTIKKEPQATFSRLCEIVYESYGKEKKKKAGFVCGDKNPHYAIFLNTLNKLFPQAKFIHIVRDPRANVSSYRMVDFDMNSIYALSKRWDLYNESILNFRKDNQHRFLELKYEDLVSKPKEILEQICQFLEIKYDENMLDFYKKPQEWETSFRKNLKNPLDTSIINKWKNELDKNQILSVDAICKKSMETLGYSPYLIDNNYKLPMMAYLHIWHAKFVTFLEKIIYFFPAKLTSTYINLYRKQTKTY